MSSRVHRPCGQISVMLGIVVLFSTTVWGIDVGGVLVMSENLMAAANNALPNPSFEEADKPTGWEAKTWNGEGTFACEKDGRNGGRCVWISSEKGGDLSWFATVPVKPFARYRLSGWIKTKNVKLKGGEGALLNVHEMRGAKTTAVKGSKDWTQVEVEFDTDASDQLMVNCLFGGWGQATGTAWFDDLALELVSSREFKPKAVIDVSQTGPPISKYIYGQFIEHLGHCIYNGIWAEMLEDRKFFHPVGAEESPWKVSGTPGCLAMSEKDPFVGAHTPQLELDGSEARGIVQGGLWVVAGKDYVGRVVLAGDATVGPVEITLSWGDGPTGGQTEVIKKVGAEFVTSPLKFTAGADSKDARLVIVARGKGTLRIGTVSLMPADNVKGMRPDVLARLKELDAPVYRWPGGNFVSGYDWKDGIGDPDKRPPRKNPAWKGVEHNDFGLDEFIVFCREIDTDPFITVNSGQGDVKMAVEELEYANGAADTPMGKWRAQNGNPEPYQVKWWAIGNEMYGSWQLGHMPLEQYVLKNNKFADAMRAVDPEIQLIAVGATGKWSRTMLAECADHMDLLSEHFYCGEKPGLLSHVRQIPDNVRRKAEAHRWYHEDIPALKGKFIPIALDEWNYWYGPELYGEIGVRYFLRDALGIAAGIHEYTRNSDIFFMANYAQTVNVIGAIKTNPIAAQFDTTGLALKLYRQHYGTIPIQVGGSHEPLDVAAAWREDRKALTIGVVNPTREKYALELEVTGTEFDAAGPGRVWIIAGDDPMAYNEPGQEPRVIINEDTLKKGHNPLDIRPVSVMLFELGVK